MADNDDKCIAAFRSDFNSLIDICMEILDEADVIINANKSNKSTKLADIKSKIKNYKECFAKTKDNVLFDAHLALFDELYSQNRKDILENTILEAALNVEISVTYGSNVNSPQQNISVNFSDVLDFYEWIEKRTKSTNQHIKNAKIYIAYYMYRIFVLSSQQYDSDNNTHDTDEITNIIRKYELQISSLKSSTSSSANNDDMSSYIDSAIQMASKFTGTIYTMMAPQGGGDKIPDATMASKKIEEILNANQTKTTLRNIVNNLRGCSSSDDIMKKLTDGLNDDTFKKSIGDTIANATNIMRQGETKPTNETPATTTSNQSNISTQVNTTTTSTTSTNQANIPNQDNTPTTSNTTAVESKTVDKNNTISAADQD